MKTLLLILLSAALTAQESPKPSMAASINGNKSVILVDPKARATDYVQAFDMLRREKPTLKIMAHTTNGVLSGVTEISTTQMGTMLMIKTVSSQGSRMQIVPVEEMMEINYSP